MTDICSLQWYDPDAITTKDGYLEITFDAIKNHNLDYRSGMLQSWNKMCFKGGLIEGIYNSLGVKVCTHSGSL